MNWLKALSDVKAKQSRLVAGILSGTSADSIDVVLASIRGSGVASQIKVVAFESFPYKLSTRKAIHKSGTLSARDVSDLNVLIGQEFADAIQKLLKKKKLSARSLNLVGSHGQTIYHHSRRSGAIRSTLQIGCGDTIAEKLGVPVFSDFRTRDVAAGGEGAPLTPYTDYVLYKPLKNGARAILNLGGIANITVLDTDIHKVRGFDTGPANAPLDRLARIISKGKLPFDKNGEIAKRGKVNEKLLATLLSHDTFLKLRPPKSTGFETYGDEFVKKLISKHGKADQNLMATAVCFIAQSVAQAMKHHLKGIRFSELVLAGGGSRNPALVSAIRAAVRPCRVRISDELGISSDAREAIAFAILANDALFGLETNLPKVTGARRAATLGKLSLP